MSGEPAISSKRALDPIDRVSEVLFGLIMVLTFTGSLSIAQAGRTEVRLARHGWQVTGVDFITKAISAARAKAARSGFEIEFLVANVTDLSALSGPFDYVLDIGCLHALKAEDRSRYAATLSRMPGPQAWYMLYAWLPRPWEGGVVGISTEEVETLLRKDFSKVRTETGEENGNPSSWYWFQRR